MRIVRWGAIGAVAVLSVAGCSGVGENSKSAGMVVDVAPGQSLSVVIPGIGRLSGGPDAFSDPGRITILPEKAAVPDEAGIQVTGGGIDVTFDGTQLRQPLELAFNAPVRPPGEDLVPVVAHRADDGTWDLKPAVIDEAGSFTLATDTFSLNIPGWATVSAWVKALKGKLASLVGGRTSPLDCRGAPSWFHLDAQHSDLVHQCATANKAPDGTEVAEVQIKSNRGVTVEVTVPGEPAYVWVEDQSWGWRKSVGNKLGFDPNRTVLLPAGARMTVGYKRAATSAPFSFFVSGSTPKASVDTFVRAAVDYAGGEFAFVAYTEIKCVSGLSVGPAVVNFGVAEWFEFLKCWTSALATELSDRDNALKIASAIDAKTDVGMLVRKAKAARSLGWLVKLWPAFQLGFGNDIDKIRELITDGRTAQVTFHSDPQVATPGPTRQPPPGTQQQPANPPATPENHGPVPPAANPPDEPQKPPAGPPQYHETTGGPTNTWTNYQNAGGQEGPTIPGHQTVLVACRLEGFAVANGNTWWYRIASPGWDSRFYASADAFYNNGQTAGTLKGTPWMDPAVPHC